MKSSTKKRKMEEFKFAAYVRRYRVVQLHRTPAPLLSYNVCGGGAHVPQHMTFGS